MGLSRSLQPRPLSGAKRTSISGGGRSACSQSRKSRRLAHEPDYRELYLLGSFLKGWVVYKAKSFSVVRMCQLCKIDPSNDGTMWKLAEKSLNSLILRRILPHSCYIQPVPRSWRDIQNWLPIMFKEISLFSTAKSSTACFT